MRRTTITLAAGICAALTYLTPPAYADPQRVLTSREDQIDLSVTAYNDGRGFVRDIRKITLPVGEVQLQIEDVSASIKPETVGFRSLTGPGSLAILEQNYEYDLISPQKLMEKYVGKQVTLINLHKDYTFEQVPATLLSTNEGPVYRVNNQIYLGHPGVVVLPEIPENLIAKPSLLCLVKNESAEQTFETTYLTDGIRWEANYVVTIPRDESALNLNGWVTLQNDSGTDYVNAQVKLIAGEVHRAPAPREQMVMMKAMSAEGDVEMAEQEAFSEFHLYTLPRRTTIKHNQRKQVALLRTEGVAFTRRYEFRGEDYYYFNFVPESREQNVDAFVEFQNTKENRLGVPLPAGVMRMYQEDSSGSLQFAGEDRIPHTAKDEKVKLAVGKSFDIVAKRVQTDYKIIADRVNESAFEITLRNHKDKDVTVDVVESLPGDWEVLQKSHDFEKRDARTIVFSVPVPKDGEVKVTYRIRVRM